MKPRVLVLLRYYLPGYKAGGPLRTVSNLVTQLSDEFDFSVISFDRDAGDRQPYKTIIREEWNVVGLANVFYLSPGLGSSFRLIHLIRKSRSDIIYLNSAFDPLFTFVPLVALCLGIINQHKIILAPRGEFAQSALTQKKWKKLPYMRSVARLLFARVATWQASSQIEAEDIRKEVSGARSIFVAPNTSTVVVAPDLHTVSTPIPAALELVGSEIIRVVFLSRISPVKNLEFALLVLSKCIVPVIFDIYGPVGDSAYWEKCQALIRDMPSSVQISYRGSIPNEHVSRVLGQYDLLFLPTRGENYGHVIAEALTVGTSALIADTTPWRDLEAKGLGWDVALSSPATFVSIIEGYARTTSEEKALRRKRVNNNVLAILNDPKIVSANRELFRKVSNLSYLHN